MALVNEIGGRLSSQGVAGLPGTTVGWTIFSRELQETPDQAVAIVPTGGIQQEHNEPLNRQTFQVMVRSAATSSTGLEAKVNDVVTALNLFSGTVAGRKYVDIQKQGDEAYLGRDENQRPMYSINFLAFRSRTT